MGVFNRMMAVSYANTWALSRNRNFRDYSGRGSGGDCTNFVSQVMLAGGWPEVYGIPPQQWFYKGDGIEVLAGIPLNQPSRSWAGAQPFSEFIESSGRAKRCNREDLELADIVQVYLKERGEVVHTVVVTDVIHAQHKRSDIDQFYVCYHSNDHRNKLLDQFEANYSGDKAEFLYWKVQDTFPLVMEYRTVRSLLAP